MKTISLLCVVSALIATGSAAQASASDDKPVIVRAQPDDLLPTRRVSYADLNLASAQGEKTLFRRVSGAVSDVCQEAEGSATISFAYQYCRKFAWDSATPQMERAIGRARELAATGHSSIAPVAIVISVAR